MAESDQKALMLTRRMILDGKIQAGEKITETALADQLQLSRTPVRLALQTLQAEGLVEKLPGRGYLVRKIGLEEVHQSIEVRATLEGMAARLLAERGMTSEVRKLLLSSLDISRSVASSTVLTEQSQQEYQRANLLFHNTIMNNCGNNALFRSSELLGHLPKTGLLLFEHPVFHESIDRLRLSHYQHQLIFDAIDQRQGSRAEALMREHHLAIINQRLP